MVMLSAFVLTGCAPEGSRTVTSDSAQTTAPTYAPTDTGSTGDTTTPGPVADGTQSVKQCGATSRSIVSAANSNGATQTCVASLPDSKASNTAVMASVTNAGSYSLVCKNSGQWNTTATIANCPAPAVVISPTPTPTPVPAPIAKSRGIRLDPSYFYSLHAGQLATQIAKDVVTTLKNAQVNTIYLYAYNSVSGAFYPTTYAQTTVEAGYGVQNIFGAVTVEAKAQGLKVVAVMPLTNFKSVWTNNPSWRVKQAGNADYMPMSDTYLLSASVLEYRNWYVGLINDLIARNPNIDQVEAVEPTLDYFWSGVPDQNPAALTLFNAQYAGAAVGTASWLNFRAQEFLNLIKLFNQTVHAKAKESALVQTWTVKSDGTLLDVKSIKDSTGFDFIGVSTLSGTQKTDHLITEFIWQQWMAEYGTSVFSPDWISSIGASYNNTIKAAGGTSDLIVHVEISTFSGTVKTVVPTKDEFGRTMAATKNLVNGVSVYDYNQIRTQGAFTELSRWY